MRTMATVLVCVLISALAGLVVGVAVSRARWLRRIVMSLMDLMQSTPHYAYFVPIPRLHRDPEAPHRQAAQGHARAGALRRRARRI